MMSRLNFLIFLGIKEKQLTTKDTKSTKVLFLRNKNDEAFHFVFLVLSGKKKKQLITMNIKTAKQFSFVLFNDEKTLHQ